MRGRARQVECMREGRKGEWRGRDGEREGEERGGKGKNMKRGESRDGREGERRGVNTYCLGKHYLEAFRLHSAFACQPYANFIYYDFCKQED